MSQHPNLKEHFITLHQDAVYWKADRLWKDATDPDEQAMAMDSLVKMMSCIPNETKRISYVSDIQKHLGIKQRLLDKQVKELLLKKKKDQEEQAMKAKFEKEIQTAEEAGLPENFKGRIHDALKYGLYEHNDVYYSRGPKGDYPISNFTMKILYHVDTSDDQAYRLIAVKNVYGFEVTINLNTDDFVSLGAFKKVLARRGDYIFKGADTDLSRLQEYLQKDEIKTTYVQTLGFNKRGLFWAWGNGIIPLAHNADLPSKFLKVDEHGIVSFNEKKYFIPACSKMFEEKDDKFVNEKKFIYVEPLPNFGFTEWSDLLYKTYGPKSIAAILFYISTIFSDIIFKHLQRFPLLNLFGPPGGGKGQLAESILTMFGVKQDQIMLGGASTAVGFMRKLAQLKNAPVWLDEFKNNLPTKFIESLKNIFDRKGYERGKMTNDFTTESTPINSTCILSGQEIPNDEALFMRCIMLGFTEGKFSDEQRTWFQKLKQEYETHGLSYITSDILEYRKNVEEYFKEKNKLIFKEVRDETKTVDIDDRIITNVSILLSVMNIFSEDNILQFPFTYAEAKDFMVENMLHQNAILAGNDEVSKFWSVVETLFHQDLILEGKDFVFEDGYLFIRVQQVHPLYQKELIQRRDMTALSKSTLDYYLQLDKTAYKDHVRKRFPDGSNAWCFQMKYEKLNIDLIRVKMETGMNIDQHNRAIEEKNAAAGIKQELFQREEDPFPISQTG